MKECHAKLALLILVFCLCPQALTGCLKAGPDYVEPELEVAEGFKEIHEPEIRQGTAEIAAWWSIFRDPLLTRLIEDARDQNLDVQIAAARVREAWANLGVISGQWFPQVQGQAEITHGEEFPPSSDSGAKTRTSSGFVLGWELDFFGKIQRGAESAAALVEAAEEDRMNVLISLYAEVAKNYFLLRQLQAQLNSAARNIEAQREVLSITKTRFENGLVSGLDVAQAERILANSEAELPVYRSGIVKAINALSLLLGRQPGAVYEELKSDSPVPEVPETVIIDIPADVIRRRPDVRAAERKLAAQTALVGAATADLYPAFSLGGVFSYRTISQGGPKDVAWSVGPLFTWDLLDFGRIRSSIALEEARTEQAYLSYEQTVLRALTEAENSLRDYIEQKNRVLSLQKALTAAQNTFRLATELYTDGLVDFQNVLDAEQAVFVTETRLEEAKGETAISLALLYKAFGGGWDTSSVSNKDVSSTRTNWRTPSSVASSITK